MRIFGDAYIHLTRRAGLLIRRQKNGNDYEKRVHAGQRRACVGHLAQSSRPQIVSAVRERDQRPAEKWSGLGRTSRTGDAATVTGGLFQSSSFVPCTLV